MKKLVLILAVLFSLGASAQLTRPDGSACPSKKYMWAVFAQHYGISMGSVAGAFIYNYYYYGDCWMDIWNQRYLKLDPIQIEEDVKKGLYIDDDLELLVED